MSAQRGWKDVANVDRDVKLSKRVASDWLTGESQSLLNKCLNIVIVKKSKIGWSMWSHFHVNMTGFIPTLMCQRPCLQTLL